ncbi:MAG TPA: PQQ-binding-like beta-propeller repeat protein [Pirellulaceae bacterium]|nr:PQQ-binding-like beta-propeller repeat protein [Pirellulaceae bacterium]
MSIRRLFRITTLVATAALGLVLISGLTAAPSVKPPSDLAVQEAKRGEWSRWRGPNGDGLSAETGLLKEWPAEGPPLAWQAKGFGGGMASVAVAGGKIYTLGRKGETHMIAASVKDGKILWSTPIGNTGGNPNCTPTVDGDLVFGLSNGGDLGCVNAKTGKLVWHKHLERDLGGMGIGYGFSESPLVDGDRLICTPGGNDSLLAALDKKTGKVIWQTKVDQPLGNRGSDGAGYASIVISHGGGVKQYVTLVGRGIVSVDAASGKLLWCYNGVANGTANIPTPIVSGDFVFCSTGYGTGSALLKLSKDGSGVKAEEQYFLEGNKLQNHHGGMILKDGYVFCGHQHNEGFPICVEMQTGKIAWGGKDRGPGGGSAAVVYADGNFYFRYQDGIMALIEANPQEYKLNGKFKIKTHNDNSWPHPVIAGGKLYLRDQDDLLCYDIKAK